MPMLADIEDPPKSRVPGLVVGFLLAAPVVAVLALWLIPAFVAAILGGARDLDERLRAKDAYMGQLCASGLAPASDPTRDDDLCGCVLAVEVPSLDCNAHFNLWSMQRQMETCSDPATHESALSFCTCIDTVAQKMGEAPDDDARRQAAQPYERCEQLGDALPLPALPEPTQ